MVKWMSKEPHPYKSVCNSLFWSCQFIQDGFWNLWFCDSCFSETCWWAWFWHPREELSSYRTACIWSTKWSDSPHVTFLSWAMNERWGMHRLWILIIEVLKSTNLRATSDYVWSMKASLDWMRIIGHHLVTEVTASVILKTCVMSCHHSWLLQMCCELWRTKGDLCLQNHICSCSDNSDEPASYPLDISSQYVLAFTRICVQYYDLHKTSQNSTSNDASKRWELCILSTITYAAARIGWN